MTRNSLGYPSVLLLWA